MKRVPRKLDQARVALAGQFVYPDRKHLTELIENEGGAAGRSVTKKTTLAVLGDGSTAKAAAKAAQVGVPTLTVRQFVLQMVPTEEEALALLRQGAAGVQRWNLLVSMIPHDVNLALDLRGADLSGLDLAGADLTDIDLRGANLANTNLVGAAVDRVRGACFDGARLQSLNCDELVECSLRGANLEELWIRRAQHCDFSQANMRELRFYGSPSLGSNTFRDADLRQLGGEDANFQGADFSGSDLRGADFGNAGLSSANFRKCRLDGAILVGADLCDADLRGASFVGARLGGTKLDGANVKGADFTGALLHGIDPELLRGAKGVGKATVTQGQCATAVRRFSAAAGKAARLACTFQVEGPAGYDRAEVEIASQSWGPTFHARLYRAGEIEDHCGGRTKSVTAAFRDAANHLGSGRINWATVRVKSAKSPVKGKALRETVLEALAEAFGQPVPPPDEMKALVKAYRDANPKPAKEKAAPKPEPEKPREIVPVEDLGGFLKQLAVHADSGRIQRAKKMLKASSFQLFSDVSATALAGVVKSQSDASLVYACRLDADGEFSCCTQNLYTCGGLRGALCKHLLVLIIGLTKAGELDPVAVNEWVQRSLDRKQKLDEDSMGDIFLRYKGAEAGEIDWRPTETVPEDYYAF